MTGFPHDEIKPFDKEGGKKQQVSDMFDTIAGRYDFMNRFLSIGIDGLWRKKAIEQFARDQPQYIIDIATGTGDMAIRAAKRLRPRKIVGIDISRKMLEIGRRKIAKEKLSASIELLSGDSETIAFEDNTFDGAMVAFGVRNFENLEKGLKEILRVMQPGAHLVVLEFSRPTLPLIKQIYKLYMGVIAPQIAHLFRQNKKAYQYLNNSANAFPDREAFVTILNKAGYVYTNYRPLTLGICCMYSARKA